MTSTNLRKWAVVFAVVFASVAAAFAGGEEATQPKAPARYVILMIADGMGFNHVDAASAYEYGRPGALVFQDFPVKFAVSTYPAGGGYDPKAAWSDFDYVRHGTTDSAAAATALATGQKTYNGAIGVIGSEDSPHPVRNVAEAAEQCLMSTGIVTSSYLSDATPSAFGAHNVKRGNYSEIAQEMFGKSAVDVIMGCGNPYYDRGGGRIEEEISFQFVGGKDTWDALAAGTIGGDADGDGASDHWKLIQTHEEFAALAEGPAPKRVCGIPQVETTLQQKRKGDANAAPRAVPFTQTVPTLAEMTRAAINVLDEDKDGFFLIVEGGAVDPAAHSNQSGRMIEEQIEFADAVRAVVEWVEAKGSWDETLLIVTGDHETGYLTGPASGPGQAGEDKAQQPVWNAIVPNGAGRLPGMQWNSKGHTNSLIAMYAKGRAAALFEKYADQEDPVRGRYIDNTEIAKVIFEVIEGEPAAAESAGAPQMPSPPAPAPERN